MGVEPPRAVTEGGAGREGVEQPVNGCSLRQLRCTSVPFLFADLAEAKGVGSGVFSLSDFALNWCLPEGLMLFHSGWLRGVITKSRMTEWPLGLPLIVIHRFSPQRGSHITAPGAAPDRNPPVFAPTGRKRLGLVSRETEDQIGALSKERLEQLEEALLDFRRRDDLDAWLQAHGS